MRQNIGLSQRELAEQTGIPLRTIQQYEQRQKNINKAQAEYLVAFSQVLCCEVSDLMEKVDKEARQRREQKEQLWRKECDALLKGYGYGEEYVEANFYRRDTDCYMVVQIQEITQSWQKLT